MEGELRFEEAELARCKGVHCVHFWQRDRAGEGSVVGGKPGVQGAVAGAQQWRRREARIRICLGFLLGMVGIQGQVLSRGQDGTGHVQDQILEAK